MLEPDATPRRQRIVVIEDDTAIAAAIVGGLRRCGFDVELATDGRRGLEKASAEHVDLVVLDLMLPELDGEEVLEALCSRCAAPVIVVTARTEIETRVGVFELGAVDYLAKPFFVEELVARVQARLRVTTATAHERHRFGELVIDLHARTVRLADVDVRLTPTELAILAYLVRRPGIVVGRHELAGVLTDLGESGARNIDAHVARLRKKLGSAAAAVVTVWGYGYRFTSEVAREAQ